MTAPYATVPDHRPPNVRARSVPTWAGILAALIAGAVVVLAVVVGLVSGDPAPADAGAVATVVVDGTDPVQLDDGIVTTPCFSYRVPDDLELNQQSAGCWTAVGFRADGPTLIRVVAMAGGSRHDIAELVAEYRRDSIESDDLDVDTVTVLGRAAVRIRSVDARGFGHTSYLVPLPTGRFTQADEALDIISLTTSSSPELDHWMATVLDSLDVPGD